jgi:hypothetical protein
MTKLIPFVSANESLDVGCAFLQSPISLLTPSIDFVAQKDGGITYFQKVTN